MATIELGNTHSSPYLIAYTDLHRYVDERQLGLHMKHSLPTASIISNGSRASAASDTTDRENVSVSIIMESLSPPPGTSPNLRPPQSPKFSSGKDPGRPLPRDAIGSGDEYSIPE